MPTSTSSSLVHRIFPQPFRVFLTRRLIMANADVVVYNIAVFVTTLFLLEFGADKFIDHTVIVAHRTGIPETIIGLITAGGEWEEVR
jgi:hypothetical protein